MHETAVVAVEFSRDSEVLATGSQDGQLKVWIVATGQCARKFDRAHDGGTCGVYNIQLRPEGEGLLLPPPRELALVCVSASSSCRRSFLARAA